MQTRGRAAQAAHLPQQLQQQRHRGRRQPQGGEQGERRPKAQRLSETKPPEPRSEDESSGPATELRRARQVISDLLDEQRVDRRDLLDAYARNKVLVEELRRPPQYWRRSSPARREMPRTGPPAPRNGDEDTSTGAEGTSARDRLRPGRVAEPPPPPPGSPPRSQLPTIVNIHTRKHQTRTRPSGDEERMDQQVIHSDVPVTLTSAVVTELVPINTIFSS